MALGRHMLDMYLLCMTNASVTMYCPNEFASDCLFLDLVSFQAIDNIAGLEDESVLVEDEGALARVFFAVRLPVHAANDRHSPSSHCAVYIWSVVLLLVPIYGLARVTRVKFKTWTFSKLGPFLATWAAFLYRLLLPLLKTWDLSNSGYVDPVLK